MQYKFPVFQSLKELYNSFFYLMGFAKIT